MKDEIALGNVMVDCGDEKALQRFYGELLGWEICELYGRPAVRSRSRCTSIFRWKACRRPCAGRSSWALIRRRSSTAATIL